MALLMKSWSCNNPSQKGYSMNVLENFHIHLHKCILNTLRTGAFKLFKRTFPGFKQYKSTFILCFFKNL